MPVFPWSPGWKSGGGPFVSPTSDLKNVQTHRITYPHCLRRRVLLRRPRLHCRTRLQCCPWPLSGRPRHRLRPSGYLHPAAGRPITLPQRQMKTIQTSTGIQLLPTILQREIRRNALVVLLANLGARRTAGYSRAVCLARHSSKLSTDIWQHSTYGLTHHSLPAGIFLAVARSKLNPDDYPPGRRSLIGPFKFISNSPAGPEGRSSISLPASFVLSTI